METVLSAKTSALCFNKDDFMVNDFSVDKFVSNYRKYVSLETMLADLGVYHRILCSAMIELINKDYADFLNLSSNLVGLDKSIKILCQPLENLQSDIKVMKENLHETLHNARSLFLKYSASHKMKVLAHHAFCVLVSLEKVEYLNSLSLTVEKIPTDLLERMALDFNIVQFHMKKVSCLKSIESKKGVVEEIAVSLQHHLEKLFLQSLTTNDTKCLLRVLRIYTVISMESKLEKLFAQVIVKPYMECHITEEDILNVGLSYVYDKVFDFIASSTAILDATRRTEKSIDIVPGFEFLVNSIFPQVVCCFDLINSVHIYAHGDPQRFHQNFSATMVFLDRFEHACGNQKSVQKLRKHESYERFINKWNLDVYFQIILSEIAGKLEKSILEGFVCSKDLKFKKRGDSHSYLLNSCKTLSECVNLCWDENVFLKPLSHCFFRLNLKLISRFCKAAYSYLKNDDEEFTNPVDTALIIRDDEMLITELAKLFEDKIIHCVPQDVVEVAFQQSVKLLEEIIPLASSVMIKSLTKHCCIHLKLISDIPRLYRKTNREVPSKPSSYVALVFNTLTKFISETDSILPAKSKKFCLREVINGIFVQCVAMIRDVLTAIKKMEDSLKILKRARDKNSIGTTGITDDDKIRMQLKIDINAFEEKARELQLEIDDLRSFKELKDLISSTEKILPQNF